MELSRAFYEAVYELLGQELARGGRQDVEPAAAKPRQRASKRPKNRNTRLRIDCTEQFLTRDSVGLYLIGLDGPGFVPQKWLLDAELTAIEQSKELPFLYIPRWLVEDRVKREKWPKQFLEAPEMEGEDDDED